MIGDGEAMLFRDAFRSSPVSCRQTTLPVAASRHRATRPPVFSSTLLTNTRSPHTIGVDPLWPGIGAAQATFSVRLNVAGRFVSVVEPLKNGPRHCGQFSPRASELARDSRATATTQQRIRFIGRSIFGSPSSVISRPAAAPRVFPRHFRSAASRADSFRHAAIDRARCATSPGMP